MRLEDFSLPESDVRAIARILGETAGLPDPNDQRAFLMTELARLIGTDSWVWGVSPLLEPGSQPVYIFHQTAGFDGPRMSRFLQAVEHPDSGAMTAPIAQAMVSTGAQVTRARQQIIPDERFLGSPANAFWTAAGIGPLLLSLRPHPGYGTTVVGFYRPVEAPPFTARETRIAHIVLSEVPWLHESGLPHLAARPTPSLPPRCRLIVNQLIRGRSRREIAADLGISPETVGGYVKQIYTHFGVHSQAEMIARFTRGNGHDLQ